MFSEEDRSLRVVVVAFALPVASPPIQPQSVLKIVFAIEIDPVGTALAGKCFHGFEQQASETPPSKAGTHVKTLALGGAYQQRDRPQHHAAGRNSVDVADPHAGARIAEEGSCLLRRIAVRYAHDFVVLLQELLRSRKISDGRVFTFKQGALRCPYGSFTLGQDPVFLQKDCGTLHILKTTRIRTHLFRVDQRDFCAGPDELAARGRSTMEIMGKIGCRAVVKSAVLWLGLVALSTEAQSPASQSGNGAANSSGGMSSSSGGNLQSVQRVQQQVSQPGPSVAPSSQTDASYRGSLIRDKATDGVLALGLDDAIARALRNNLGLILQSSSEGASNGQRLQQLQDLLPTLTGAASITIQQVNLAAYGLKFPGLNPIVGPFQVVDFRAYLTQNLVNLQSLQKYYAARHNFQAAKLTAEDARDIVVLTTGNAYLLCIADAARITAVQAELATSKVSLDQAVANHEAGTSPRIDVLRAQVDYQNEQQNLISTQNQLEKDKLALARVIGLPLEQKFDLSDSVPFQQLEAPDPEAAFQQALKQRKDLASAAEQLKGAKASEKAATYEQLPTASVSGDFGDLGTTPGHSHGTFTATGQISAPILQIAKTKGDEAVARSQREQTEAKLSDQVQQVNADVRDAILDIQSSAKLVDAARSNVDLSHEALSEAQQRFRAGVADTLPVSQALSQDQQANDQYISALYQHNVAKLSLARALGAASANYKTYLLSNTGGK